MGAPVVKSTNGYGLPVTVVASGGLPVEVASNGYGAPIIEVAQGGLPITYDQGGGGFTPLADGDTIAFMGCSVDYDSNWYGLVPALCARMDYRLQPNPFGWFGWFGTRPDEWLTTMPSLLAAAPNVLWIGDWVNATVPGTAPSLSTETDVVEQCMQQFGALPTSKEIWLTTTRRVQTAEDNGNIALLDAINAWCAAQAGRKIGNARVRFFNAPYDLSNDGADKLDTRDGLHDNTRGAFSNRAKKYGDQILPLLPTGRVLPTPGSPPAGNKTTNPLFTGSSALVATGAGAANVSGTKATGIGLVNNVASGVTVVATAMDPGQRFVLSGNQPGTSDIYMTVSVAGLERGKKYIAYARYQLSAADGVSPASTIRNFSFASQSPIAIGNDGRGALITGYGDVPSPMRGTNYPLNPETGVAEYIGEPWLVSRPKTCPNNGSSQFRFLMTPFVGAVDMMIDFTDFVVVEIHERKAKPYYQGAVLNRIGTGTYLRFADGYIGPYSCGGNFPAQNSTTKLYSIATANANNLWLFSPGDWSGDPDSYDGTVEVMKSGSGTWTQVVASLAAASWQFNFTGYGLAAGDQVRTTVTATSTGFTPTTASEIITVT